MMFFVIIFLVMKNGQAATSTVRGAAWWSDQSSYLYFNCLDDVTGDKLDFAHNLCGGLVAPPYPGVCGEGQYAFHFFAPPCTALTHQVYINSNGNFSGSAWNYAKGLISFEGTTTPDNYSFNTYCPTPLTCNSSNNCLACYNENTQKVYGWARAADNSWINLNPATTTPAQALQIKSWNPASSTDVFYYSFNPGDFIGYATTTASSISFNCRSEGGLAGNCATRDYKTYISNLQIGHLSAPNWNYSQACGTSGSLVANLTWDLKSGGDILSDPSLIDHQIGFQVMASTNNSTTTGTIYDSGLQSGSSQSFEINKTNFPAMTYNTEYYWWVRLQDQNYNWTQWYQFGANDGHNGLADTITDLGGTYSGPDAKTFKTYKNEFPSPYFSWSPYKVEVASSTEFTSAGSQYYSGGTPLPCSGINCVYLWTTDDPGASISNATSATTSIMFFAATGTRVTLQVSEALDNNYTCSTSTVLSINYGLPIWREVKAQ